MRGMMLLTILVLSTLMLLVSTSTRGESFTLPIVSEEPDTATTTLSLDGDTLAKTDSLICFTPNEWAAIQYGLIAWTAMSHLAGIRLGIIIQQDSLVNECIERMELQKQMVKEERNKVRDLTDGLSSANAKLTLCSDDLTKEERRKRNWRTVALIGIGLETLILVTTLGVVLK